jgi:hypothetical protein
MTSTITPQSKNTALLTNQAKSVQAVTWDEATFSWDNAQGTWDIPGQVYGNQTKNTATLTNQNKN